MALPQHFLIALVSPFGRINQFGFAILAIVLGFAHIYIYAQLKFQPGLPMWNGYTITLFVMLWMKFCILSRRLHDTGSNGMFLVPVLFVTAFLYLVAIDPIGMGMAHVKSGVFQYFVEQGIGLPRALLIAVFLYCIRAQGESGPNGYGPEFGQSADDAGGRSSDAHYGGNVPQHAYGAIGGGQPASSGWSERRRPQGFGRR